MEKTDILLEGSTATWTMPPTTSELGGTYTGRFVFKCYLDPLSQLQAGRQFREYLGAYAGMATESEYNLAYALAQLSQRIVTAPPFWTSTVQDGGLAGNIGDGSIVLMVLDAAVRAQDLFKEKIAKEREQLLDQSIKVGEQIMKERQKGE